LVDYYYKGHIAKVYLRDYTNASDLLTEFDEIVLSNSSVTKEERETIILQSEVIFKAIDDNYSDIVYAIDTSLQLLDKLCSAKEEEKEEGSAGMMVTLGSIVTDDLNRKKTFYQYEKSLRFLEKSSELFVGHDFLLEYF
jgi:hypothetical protein